ncbi:hypothetical protein [Mycolicibacterium holsaticum]|uniref:Uncharacterized protein n=1 Tax=Mycolicibacterium holsaticum TaxID=152142 RepID=A0A1E3RJB5_9MYCO|nr:hypothetical protein [Mycolicibacterium holsaticum]ODQ89954.1 hypothetical protein BHQ17_17685 [Mycolicibacterium holsaticum]
MSTSFLDLLEDNELFGADGPGYFTWADTISKKHGNTFKTTDGIAFGEVIKEFLDTLSIYNSKQQKLVSLLSYPTTDFFAADPVDGNVKFERATEHGVPRGIETGDLITLGFDLRDYDAATRYTWKYLREVSSDELARVHGEAMAADQELLTKTILQRIMTPTGATPPKTARGHNIYSLYNGADGVVPPKFETNTFTSSTTMYMATNAATIDSGDIETAITAVQQHGYGIQERGQQLVILANAVESKVIQRFRAGVENNNEQVAQYDFIPSTNAPARIEDGTLFGTEPAGDFHGVPIKGSYGPALLAESYLMPQGYVLVFSTAGPNSPQNVCAFREHPDAIWRGLRLLPGNQQAYPLADAFYSRTFGTGVRNRAAAAAIRVVASTTYTAPTFSLPLR